MSVREKQVFRSKLKKEHCSSNARAGHVPVNDTLLHSTGIRGTKQHVVCALIGLLLLAAVANILVTITIMAVLQIDHRGMLSLEMVADDEVIQFLGDTELEMVHLLHNQISGFEHDVNIGGIFGNPVILKINDKDHSQLRMHEDRIHVENIDEFVIINSETQELVFTTDFQQFKFPETMRRLDMKKLKVNVILSHPNTDISITASENVENGDVDIYGAGGISVRAKQFSMTTKESLTMTTNGSLHLLTSSGIVLTSFLDMPRIPSAQINPASNTESYKLCICNNNGRLYRVHAQGACEQISVEDNPCM